METWSQLTWEDEQDEPVGVWWHSMVNWLYLDGKLKCLSGVVGVRFTEEIENQITEQGTLGWVPTALHTRSFNWPWILGRAAASRKFVCY